MCINYLYCTTLCDSSFHMMFISFSSCSMLKPHVTFCKKNTYCNIYYCLSRTNIIAQFLLILLPSSENASIISFISLLGSTEMLLVFDVFAYLKVMKMLLVIDIILYRKVLKVLLLFDKNAYCKVLKCL